MGRGIRGNHTQAGPWLLNKCCTYTAAGAFYLRNKLTLFPPLLRFYCLSHLLRGTRPRCFSILPRARVLSPASWLTLPIYVFVIYSKRWFLSFRLFSMFSFFHARVAIFPFFSSCWTYSHYCQVADKKPSKGSRNVELRGVRICVGWISTTRFCVVGFYVPH